MAGTREERGRRRRVFLMGGDGFGWSLDEYLRLTASALDGIADVAALAEADVVHSMWWRALLSLPRESVIGKRVISYISMEAVRFLAAPDHLQVVNLVGRWVARTTREMGQLRDAGIECVHVPHMVDLETFRPLSDTDAVERLRQAHDIPRGRYLIGSFQRDTEGHDLESPKLVKGPDMFAEIVSTLQRWKLPIHVVLAGPRRFWLRRRLGELGVPFTYVGRDVAERTDDIRVNTLPRRELNILYKLIDLYVVGSRSENAPDSVLEAAAAGCKIISTDVGVAPDVLVPGCIYRSAVDGAKIARTDVEHGSLLHTVGLHRTRVETHHTVTAGAMALRRVYESLGAVPACEAQARDRHIQPERRSLVKRVAVRLGLRPRHGPISVGIWHNFRRPPYGGGNQFLLALQKSLPRHGIAVVENGPADVHLLHAVFFDTTRFERVAAREAVLRVVHRIDGPISLIRGFDRQRDEQCFQLNQRFAHATILQSAWSLRETIAMGYRPVNPVLIHNAVDPEIFHAGDRRPLDLGRRIRLISSSWSDNPRKGSGVYKWLEKHLDWSRFEYTFVGRSPVTFERIRHVPPLASHDLAKVLREHDIYVHASRFDAWSNALTEALACGLPALYLDTTSNPEVVRYGGLPFRSESEIPSQLDRLVEGYESFQRLISVPSMEEIAASYAELIRDVARSS
jgi:glycosyltransferase involved in cell wall biosynthesis